MTFDYYDSSVEIFGLPEGLVLSEEQKQKVVDWWVHSGVYMTRNRLGNQASNITGLKSYASRVPDISGNHVIRSCRVAMAVVTANG